MKNSFFTLLFSHFRYRSREGSEGGFRNKWWGIIIFSIAFTTFRFKVDDEAIAKDAPSKVESANMLNILHFSPSSSFQAALFFHHHFHFIRSHQKFEAKSQHKARKCFGKWANNLNLIYPIYPLSLLLALTLFRISVFVYIDFHWRNF